jgi:NADH-quinone oxidoreductase subunit L
MELPQSTPETDLCRWALVILLLPLAGFLVQVFFGRKIPPRERQGDWIPTAAIFGGFLIACYMVVRLLASGTGIVEQRWYPAAGLNWMAVGDAAAGATTLSAPFRMHFGILVDNLTVVMLFVVTSVSFLVHLYSWGYMHGEVRYNRFFAYLGLFTFSMLGLCITSNLLFLFIFWELVGVCSYFLIGFYFEKKSAQDASLKAFITTRVGDLGFFLAILIIGSRVGSFEFEDIFASVRSGGWADVALLTFAGLALFLGPMGKSAQFPLHIWLPDAMEGPTPVSALIHAATMVAAGVYLVGRMFPFMAGPEYWSGNFLHSDALFVVAIIGGFTAFFAATIAFAQTDIKKVLAYSTVSQLGYMMLGLGVGSVSAALFHLTTHAFFKALLFLGSGSVIHAVHSNEMADMGGLRRKMPITWTTFLIGTLAIAGLPLLSGFYSKEAILGQALAFGQHKQGAVLAYLPFLFGITTAGMTAFYMFRLFFSVFHGEPRNRHAHDHAHESPWTMTLPLCVLAFLSLVAGGLPFGPFKSDWFENRVSSTVLEPPTTLVTHEHVQHLAHDAHSTVLYLSVGMFAAGLLLSSLFFLPWGPFYRLDIFRSGSPLAALHAALRNLWYVDRALTWLALRFVHVSQVAAGAFDKYVIDGLVNFWGSACRYVTGVVGAMDYWGVDGTVRGIGDACLRAGARLRRLQSGLLQEYVYASLFIFTGVFIVSMLLVFFW